MIGWWRGASWFVRGLVLVCLYVILDSLSSIGVLYFAQVRDGDPLDRYTAVRIERGGGKTAVVYTYLHANSSAQLTAIHLADRDVPAIGDVRYRSPGGTQVLLSDLVPAQIDLSWRPSDRPAVALPSGVLREADWNQRGRCLSKQRAARRVCWNATELDVD